MIRFPVRAIAYLDAIRQTGSFVAAAKLCGTQQSSVSRTIAELEQYFGTPLVDRTCRPLRLTPDGEKCLANIQAFVASVIRQRHAVARRTPRRPDQITITSPAAVASDLLPIWLAELGIMRPADPVRIRIENNHQCLAVLTGGASDFACAYAHDALPLGLPPGEYEDLVLASDVLVPVCRAEDADLYVRRLLNATGPRIPLLAYTAGIYLARTVDCLLALPRFAQAFQIIHEADNCDCLVALLMHKPGIAFLPTFYLSRLRSGLIPLSSHLDGANPASSAYRLAHELRLPITVRLIRPRLRHFEPSPRSAVLNAFWNAARAKSDLDRRRSL